MACDNSEGSRGGVLVALVPVAALFAAVMGIGAGARHRRHSRHHDDPTGHRGCAHSRHHACGEGEGRCDDRDASTPLVMLQRRYASGEIDDDEFRRRWGVLHEHTTAPSPGH
jgi:hypothetical protein